MLFAQILKKNKKAIVGNMNRKVQTLIKTMKISAISDNCNEIKKRIEKILSIFKCMNK